MVGVANGKAEFGPRALGNRSLLADPRGPEIKDKVNEIKRRQKFPAICHVDNTSRVQTVSKEDNEGFYNLLKTFYNKTGCPMLLNTSLNIKGQPIVDNIEDALQFEKHYNLKVVV